MLSLSTTSLFVTIALCIFGNAQSSPENGNEYNGTLFLFEPAKGACGYTNSSSQTVASVSRHVFMTFPGATSNPNKNPICHHSIRVAYEGKSTIAAIVDYFTGPGSHNIGLSLDGFTTFAEVEDGIVENVTWSII